MQEFKEQDCALSLLSASSKEKSRMKCFLPVHVGVTSLKVLECYYISDRSCGVRGGAISWLSGSLGLSGFEECMFFLE